MDPSSAGKSPSDQGQREAFLNELNQFLSDRGRYLCRSPNLAGRIIDLHDLYNKVTSTGGYQKVTERGYWEDFLDVYGFPAISTTLAYGLQKIYQLYLEEYEKVHYFGDDEPQPFHRSFTGGYRRYRYQISDHQRLQANMNMMKPKISNYDRVVYSLESCLPNEVDFAVNACTLLSGESRHVLKLPQCNRIVDALLLHAGIVSDGYGSYHEVLQELQNKTKHDYLKFWKYSIPKKSVLPILLPDRQSKSGTNSEISSNCGRTMDLPENENSSNCDFTKRLHQRLENVCDGREKNTDKSSNGEMYEKGKNWSELFHGDRSLGVEDYEGQRVLQIALVLLNLSFEDFNVTLLARHPSLVCFVFLCIHSEYSCLRQTGFDILSNISSHMQLLHLNYDMITLMFETINSAILSNDKFERIRGFEILGNICRPRSNADYVCAHIADVVYDAAVQNLMVTDVELLIAAVEALYRLSKLGEDTCTKMIFVKGCTNILTSLVSLNVRMFGLEKLSEIRLARKIVPGQTNAQPSMSPSQPRQTYQLPPTPNPHVQHAAVSRPVVIQQPQIKIASAQQSQPTVVAVVHSPPPAAVQIQSNNVIPTQPQSTIVPTPQTPVQLPINHPPFAQPKVEASAAERLVVKPTSQAVDQGSNRQTIAPPKETTTPPPASTPPPSVPVTSTASPPGAEPTYTHSEAGTTPPVFHYMPAPPNDIVQDSTPESFTKLWIWATYESDGESYIPRVDVYCEYLASSNRYGRQGKAEILSATDFGKCLKQIFPSASSRLFNQGRGQPQYHIAGIRKRATPLPVPGYQLKNTSSVFSSEQEYERIPVPKQSTASDKPQAPQGPVAQPLQAPQVSTMSVPIQQLKFQPVLIISTPPGSNNLSLVPGSSTLNSNLVCQPQSIRTTATGVVAPVTLPVLMTSNVAGASVCSVSLSNHSCVQPSSQSAKPDDTSVRTSTAEVVIGQEESDSNSKNSRRDVEDRTKCLDNADSVCSAPNQTAMTSECSDGNMARSSQSPSNTMPNRTDTSNENSQFQTVFNHKVVVENGDESLSEHRDKGTAVSHKPATEGVIKEKAVDSNEVSLTDGTFVLNGTTSASSDNSENQHVGVSNGFLEQEDVERDPPKVSASPMDIDMEQVPLKRRKSRSKSTEHISIMKEGGPLVNGFVDDDQLDEFQLKRSNGQKDVDVFNGETEAAVNSILDTTNPIDDIIKMDVEQVAQATTASTDKIDPTKDNITQDNHQQSESSVTKECMNKSSGATLADRNTENKSEGLAVSERTDKAGLPEQDVSLSKSDSVLTEQTSNINSNNAQNTDSVTGNTEVPTTPVKTNVDMTGDDSITTTPSNPIPHSALNQRLKDTITRRMSAHVTPTSLPANNLPPSVLQQYSYKQNGLAQQIINVAPHPFHQPQLHGYRLPVIATPQAAPVVQTAAQMTRKRAATDTIDSTPVKVPRPIIPHTASTSTTNMPQNQVHQHIPRHAAPTRTHRPSPQPQHHIPVTGNSASLNPQGPIQGKAKPPTIDLMAPNASLLVLYRNVGKIPFADYTDEKEDAITKSVRLTASLILKNIVKYSNLGRSMVQQHEDVLACVAMSQMDCSPVVAKLLSELNV